MKTISYLVEVTDSNYETNRYIFSSLLDAMKLINKELECKYYDEIELYKDCIPDEDGLTHGFSGQYLEGYCLDDDHTYFIPTRK